MTNDTSMYNDQARLEGIAACARAASSFAVQGDSLNTLDNLSAIIWNAEQVIRHTVETARADGHSWSDIGTTLGMTKQAAQQRFGRPSAGASDAGQSREQQPLPL